MKSCNDTRVEGRAQRDPPFRGSRVCVPMGQRTFEGGEPCVIQLLKLKLAQVPAIALRLQLVTKIGLGTKS